MDCEQSYFSFCSLLPFAIAGFALYFSDKIVELMITGVGKGRIRKVKKALMIDTDDGMLKLPTVKLPNMEWEVHTITQSGDSYKLNDGINKMNKVECISSIRCKLFRDILICENFYNELKQDMRGFISSPFDDLCYVFTIKPGEVIDYRRYINEFLEEIEEN